MGIHEDMPAGLILRPQGTADYLFIHFYDRVTIETGKTLADFPPETAILWKPGTRHHYGMTSKKWSHSWIHFGGECIEKSILSAGTIPLNEPFMLRDSRFTDSRLLRIYEECTEHAQPDPIILEGLLRIWIREMSRWLRNQKSGKAIPEQFLALKRSVEANLSAPLRLESLAAQVNLATSQFSALFRHFFGWSPMNYVLLMRLERAAVLIEDHNKTISQIAYEVGFSNPFYFSRRFKQRYGASPLQYRNSLFSKTNRRAVRSPTHHR